MNTLDWVLVVIGLFCLGRGLMRGAISQIFGIAGVLGGFLIAAHFYLPLSVELSKSFPKLSGSEIISFIALFFLAWFCVGMAGYILAGLIHRTGLGFVDRFWGGLVGILKALAISISLISILTFFLSTESEILKTSAVAPYVQQAAAMVIMATPVSVQKIFNEKRSELEKYWSSRGATQSPAPAPGRGMKESR